MTIDEIKELLVLFNESGVGELEIERDGERIRIRKAGQMAEYQVSPALTAAAQTAAAQPQETTASMESAASAPAAGEPGSGQILVKSPIVGTYYDAPSPGSAPFVTVGDAVEPGQVLCIIESMKLMNEIEAETAGVIAAKLVENGRPVEYGEALFSIRPR
ncbi:MAG: acetyl-CoA carboxylase biotin carboxyl carrier protein [Acidobacteriia bacterium]|nr:acetyl-CoA carboxylase biotin carboxyl carrier protein [Terriglobia bacterium]